MVRFSSDMKFGCGEISGETCIVARSEATDTVLVIDLDSVVTLMMAYEHFCMPPEDEDYN